MMVIKPASFITKFAASHSKLPANSHFFIMFALLMLHQISYCDKSFLTEVTIQAFNSCAVLWFLMFFPMRYHITFHVKPLAADITIKLLVKVTFIRLVMVMPHVPI